MEVKEKVVIDNLKIQAEKQKPVHNVGIEVLRIISMFMVVILHCLGHGGVLNSTAKLSVNNNLSWLLEIACYCAVDCYALITGYVCAKSKHKLARIVELWLEVLFYTVLVTIGFKIFSSDTVGLKDLIKAFLPVMSKQYWYFSSYFCLFFFIPVLNLIVTKSTKRQNQFLILTITIIFCVVGLLASYLGGDVFSIYGGYSFLWLAVLYIIGAYIKIYGFFTSKINKDYFLLSYLICVLLVWLSKIVISLVTLRIFGSIKGSELLIAYNSPLILLAAISLLLYCSQLKIKRGVKILTEISSVSFGVYLISEQNFIKENFIVNKFIKYTSLPWYLMIGYNEPLKQDTICKN